MTSVNKAPRMCAAAAADRARLTRLLGFTDLDLAEQLYMEVATATAIPAELFTAPSEEAIRAANLRRTIRLFEIAQERMRLAAADLFFGLVGPKRT